jgi:hypothetical protein
VDEEEESGCSGTPGAVVDIAALGEDSTVQSTRWEPIPRWVSVAVAVAVAVAGAAVRLLREKMANIQSQYVWKCNI